jgi:threonine aldolase
MIPSDLMSHYQAVRDRCQHRITGQLVMTMADQLAVMAQQAREFDGPDVYGKGELIESFEASVARLLAKEAAIFLPSGTMAQNIALRIWADEAGLNRVGFHATSHLEVHEQNAYRELYKLEAQLLGEADRVITLADLQAVKQGLAAILLELPMREIGGQLPDWEELQAQSQWAREQGIALHMDGARLWQCTPHYGRSMAEIASLFDSVYVSFYKDIGGIAGSVLAGPAEFAKTARTWIRRAGGNLYALYPYVLAAKAGMERNLDAMPQAVKDAQWLAQYLNRIPGLQTLPDTPPTNLFHLLAPHDPVTLVEKACEWSEKNRVFLLPVPRAQVDGHSIMEFSLGRAITTASSDQWQAWLTDFFQHLR